MSWEDEQTKLTQEARLLLSSPQIVFEELREQSRKNKFDLFSAKSETLEPRLVERSDPLINFAIACYGVNKQVFSALYKHSREPARDAADGHYKRGLRVGCLTNKTIAEAQWIFEFPKDLIGEEELGRLLREGDCVELEALICNPKLADSVLEALYKHTGPFASVPDERWCELVYFSRKNERLVTEKEYRDSPDLGFMHIHDAIFEMLATAPVDRRWMRCLYELLDNLNFDRLETPKQLNHVLGRWAALDDTSDGKPSDGYFTSLSLKDEFRCLVAAMYGRGYADKAWVQFGTPDAKDVALRCAYYGKGDLNLKDMKAGYEKDEDVFVFAAMYNSGILFSRELREHFEREQVSGDLRRRYLRNFEHLKERWKNLGDSFVEPEEDEIDKEDPNVARFDRIEIAVRGLQDTVNKLAASIQTTQTYLVIAAIAVAASIYFRK